MRVGQPYDGSIVKKTWAGKCNGIHGNYAETESGKLYFADNKNGSWNKVKEGDDINE